MSIRKAPAAVLDNVARYLRRIQGSGRTFNQIRYNIAQIVAADARALYRQYGSSPTTSGAVLAAASLGKRKGKHPPHRPFNYRSTYMMISEAIPRPAATPTGAGNAYHVGVDKTARYPADARTGKFSATRGRKLHYIARWLEEGKPYQYKITLRSMIYLKTVLAGRPGYHAPRRAHPNWAIAPEKLDRVISITTITPPDKKVWTKIFQSVSKYDGIYKRQVTAFFKKLGREHGAFVVGEL